MKQTLLILGVLCGVVLTAPAQAQLSLNLTLPAVADNITVAPGGLALFNATLSAGSEGAIFLDGIGVTLTNYERTTWQDGGASFFANFPDSSLGESLAASTSASGELFQVTLAGSLGNAIPGATYTGNVSVEYHIGSDFSPLLLTKNFTVTSQTPTPPVILVTLLSGIGTARMALRRRKKT